MRSAMLAEWLLARFTDESRAMAMVGDLEETAGQKGRAWFWRSFLGALMACAWRPVAGYFTAAFGGLYLAQRCSSAFFASTQWHAPDAAQRAWGSSLSVLVGMLCFIALYTIVRFGFRDVLALVSAGFALLGSIAVCFWWQTPVVLSVVGLSVAALSLSMCFRRTRRALAAMAALAGFQVVLWMLCFMLFAMFFQHIHTSMLVVGAAGVALAFAAVALICVACSSIHRILLEMRPKPVDQVLS